MGHPRSHVIEVLCRVGSLEASHRAGWWNSIFKFCIRGIGSCAHSELPTGENRQENRLDYLLLIHCKYFPAVNTSAQQSKKRSSFYLTSKRNFSSETAEQKSLLLDNICSVLRGSHKLSHDKMNEAFNDLAIGWNPDLVKDVVQKLEDPEIALKFFYWVDKQRGYKHSHITYNAIIEIQGLAGRFEQVEMLLNTMRNSGCKITAATYTILIRSYGKAGMVAAASALLLEMVQHHGHNIQAANCLLEAHIQSQRVESALFIYNKMRHSRWSPNEFTISILTRGLCVAGRLEEAQKLVTEAPTVNTVVFNELVKGLCKNGRLNEGYAVLDQMTEKGLAPDIYTYNTLIVGYCKANEFDTSVKLFNEMVEKGITPDSVTIGTLVTVMVCMCKSKESRSAYKLLVDVVSAGYHFTHSQWVALHRAFLPTIIRNKARKVLLGCQKIV